MLVIFYAVARQGFTRKVIFKQKLTGKEQAPLLSQEGCSKQREQQLGGTCVPDLQLRLNFQDNQRGLKAKMQK